MHYILIIGALTLHYPSLERCEVVRQGYVQAGNKVSDCIDQTLIKPRQESPSVKAFKQGWKKEMAKPEQPMEQDI